MIRIFEMGKISEAEIFARFETTSSVEDAVKEIIAHVRAEGDAALREYSSRFDHVDLTDFQVSEEERAEAEIARLNEELSLMLGEAAGVLGAYADDDEGLEAELRGTVAEGAAAEPLLTEKISIILLTAIRWSGFFFLS